jgi:SAM-dependent methyltransferase
VNYRERNLDNAEQLIGLSRAYWASQALFVAVRLNVFGYLDREGTARASDAASVLGTDHEATRRLLDVLTGLDLLHKQGKYYRNAPLAVAYLVPEREGYLGHAVHHAENLWSYWGELFQAVQTGKPIAFEVMEKGAYDYRHRLEDYLLAMRDQAGLLAPAMARVFNLSDCRSLLDLGSGPGEYAKTFAQHYLHLKVTLYDHEATLEVVKEWAASWKGLEGRIEFRAGDFLQEELSPPFYDAIFFSQAIHIYDSPTNSALVEKAFRALCSGGKLAIHDYLLEENCAVPLAGSLFALNMLLGTPSGTCHPATKVATWLTTAGFKEINHVSISPSTSLVVGSKP